MRRTAPEETAPLAAARSIEWNVSYHLPFQVLIDVARTLRADQCFVNLVQLARASALPAQSRNRVISSDLSTRDDRDTVGELFNQLRHRRGENDRVMIADRAALQHSLHGKDAGGIESAGKWLVQEHHRR